MFQLLLLSTLNSKFCSSIGGGQCITKFTSDQTETTDIISSSASTGAFSKSIFESEHGKVHPGDDLKKPSVGPKIAGVQLNKIVNNTKFHSVATPGKHF